MMESEKKPRAFFRPLLICIILLLLALPASPVFIQKLLPRAEEFLKSGKGSDALERIKEEISKSGKLIANREAANAHLTRDGIVAFTNARRVEAGMTPYSSNELLHRVAERRLEDMFADQYFEHVAPDGRSAADEAEAVGYEYIAIGENIALGNFENDEVLVQAWMDSPGHRANIVHERFTELGVAARKGEFEGRTTWIAVQIFARPLSTCERPNGALEVRVNRDIERLETMQGDLAALEDRIEAMESDANRNESEYEEAIRSYNELAREYNTLAQTVRRSVDEYNRVVRRFNACIEE